ncbi:Rieske 2Fe-2S domain-containing protein [Altererythrobacter buctensis]|uniref:Rieske 2Fe-2S domain-containing protein n=2 Tax=Alteraurantiacibacter buctensis TaxID=1503981 RepID=A0A844YTZ6_9SPHN|nr:aromatic ring-hydroxylating dioxygenase subunit alpha [Alteraurantiacibacter buctensis]MXO71795.1 Rieske 2Fe-2S domain-containing protein [Alteraurantiacibacter buctensis]
MVRNRWYIAAFSHEIGREPMERTLLGIPVVMYRTQAGAPVAMYGLCPHRYFPLAQGRLDGDAIVCGYHGFTFAADGKCTRIPSQETGADFCQPSYPVVEHGPLCWIWMGEPGKCDPALIPPHEDFGIGDGWAHASLVRLPMKGRYQLLVDNLMDLTHLPYIHHQIDGGDAFKRTPMVAVERSHSYQLRRSVKTEWSGFFDLLFGPQHRFDGSCEMESVTDFYGPELIRTSGPIISAVEGFAEVSEALGHVYFVHGITPETATSTHYWSFTTRNHRLDDEQLDRLLDAMDIEVRQQDIDAIEAIEVRIDVASAVQRELLAKSDIHAMKVRHRIQAMLDAEAI